MKRQNKKGWQAITLVSIATIFLLGAFAPIFAQNRTKNFSALDYLSSGANHNLRHGGAFARFDFINIQTNDSCAGFNSAVEYPKPDFSEMEKWYEVVKYEYGDIEGGDTYLYFWLKPKSDTRPLFSAIYYDKDGVEMSRWAAHCDGNCYGTGSPVGVTQKFYASTPTETQMEKITTVKMTRWKN